MLTLAIETSCDETAASVVKDGKSVLSNTIATLQKDFADKGGVIPEEAARRQNELITMVIQSALEQAGVAPSDLDNVCVTVTPGLKPSLSIGISTAYTLTSVWNKPLIEVNHLDGHLYSTWLDVDEEPEFPILCLSVSGGHTTLTVLNSHEDRVIIGSTRDDAAGEAFDKGATLLGLPYPGGPEIQRVAQSGSPDIAFPLPLKDKNTLDYSFSGLKTAVKIAISHEKYSLEDLACSYQEAICRHLVDKLSKAIAIHSNISELHIVGGVSLNRRLRELCQDTFGDITLRFPSPKYCTDNAAMIAAAAYYLNSK